MLSLLVAMGVCASCGTSAEEKAEQDRLSDRRQTLEASEPLELLSASPQFKLQVHDAQTVLEVLEVRAGQIGLPKAAAVYLKMEFAESILPHHKTLKEVGLCDQAVISVLDEAEAKDKRARADAILAREAFGYGGFSNALFQGIAEQVQMVMVFYPEKANLFLKADNSTKVTEDPDHQCSHIADCGGK